MKTKAKSEFVELRARGISYREISEKLEVSKQTLINWSKELSEEIHNHKAIETEALQIEFLVARQARIKLLGATLTSLEDELLNRDLSMLPLSKLLESILKYSNQLAKEERTLLFTEKSEVDFSDIMTTKKTWEA